MGFKVIGVCGVKLWKWGMVTTSNHSTSFVTFPLQPQSPSCCAEGEIRTPLFTFLEIHTIVFRGANWMVGRPLVIASSLQLIEMDRGFSMWSIVSCIETLQSGTETNIAVPSIRNFLPFCDSSHLRISRFTSLSWNGSIGDQFVQMRTTQAQKAKVTSRGQVLGVGQGF